MSGHPDPQSPMGAPSPADRYTKVIGGKEVPTWLCYRQMPHGAGGVPGSIVGYRHPDQMQGGYGGPHPSAGGYNNQAGNCGGGILFWRSDEVNAARAKRHRRCFLVHTRPRTCIMKGRGCR